MYTTYAIVDPRSKLFVYVGQTNDMTRRQREHLAARRLRNPPAASVKARLKRMHQSKVKPLFIVLEVVETESESLTSENKWVEKIAALGHPLYNRWDEHKALIEAAEHADTRRLEPLVFGKDKTQKIGSCEPNAGKTGYRVHLAEGVELVGPVTIDLLPPKAVDED